jgi:predicted nucleotidyltransferase
VKHLSDELLEQIVQRLVATLHPLEIHLFGSHATGKAHVHSDVDLLVVVGDDAPDAFELARQAYPALASLLVPVELHFVRQRDMATWATVAPSLPSEVTRKGRKIYASKFVNAATVA